MKYLKKYEMFKENFNLTPFQEEMIRWFGDDFFEKSKEDILNIKDILIEIEDIGYNVDVNYTPTSFIAKLRRDKEAKPSIYIKIDWPGKDDFYGNLGEIREEVDYNINRVFNYLESVGGWTWLGQDFVGAHKLQKSKFLNNPTSYQYIFRYDG